MKLKPQPTRLPGWALMLLMLLFLANSAPLAAAREPSTAPMAPAFLNFMEEGGGASSGALPADGMVPSPLDLSHIRPDEEGDVGAQGFPARFDLRQEGKLPSVRDQGSYGTCWAHAALGSLESTLLPGRAENLSEWHLSYFTYSGDVHFTRRNLPSGSHPIFDQGGNSWQAAALIARWTAPVPESSSPYGGALPDGSEVPSVHLREVLYLSGLGGLSSGGFSSSAVKEALMEYGAVGGSMYWSDPLYRSSTLGFYSSAERTTNHGIVIVGWDDGYSRNNFNQTAPGDGAWLVRNSWGTWFGDDGYFYISYYDKSLDGGFLFMGGDADDLDRVYQHDALGWVRSMGYGSDTAWFASVFTSSEEESLKALSFYSAAPSSEYALYVYTGVDAGSPRSGTRRVNGVSGLLDEAGYHVVELPSAVSLTRGERFSVVVKLRTPGYSYPVPLEDRIGNYTDDASAGAGESFISSNGSSWSDVTKSFSSNANVCLKAFTSLDSGDANRVPSVPSDPEPSDGEGDVEVEPMLSWSADDPDGDSLTYRVSFGERGKTASFSTVQEASFSPGALQPGTVYTWSVTVKDGQGGQTAGPLWSFETAPETEADRAPLVPDLLGPLTDEPVNGPSVRLEWDCSDPDGDDLSCEVWVGSSPSSLNRVAAVDEESYLLEGLLPGEQLWWKVIASDGRGGKVSSAVSDFETGEWEILSETEALPGTNLDSFRVLALDLDPTDEGWSLPSGGEPRQADSVGGVSLFSLVPSDLDSLPLGGRKGLSGAAFTLDTPSATGEWTSVEVVLSLGSAELGNTLYQTILGDMNEGMSVSEALWNRVALGKVVGGAWRDMVFLASGSGALSVRYESGRFRVTLRLAVVDAFHPSESLQVVEGDSPYFVVFDGAVDGRLEDPLVFVELSDASEPLPEPDPADPVPDASGGGGGCSVAPFPVLLLVLPLLGLLRR